MQYEATHLRGNHYAVRPAGQLGTCGWHPVPWEVIYVNARSPSEAISKATGKPVFFVARKIGEYERYSVRD